jgi:hypothetical protein
LVGFDNGVGRLGWCVHHFEKIVREGFCNPNLNMDVKKNVSWWRSSWAMNKLTGRYQLSHPRIRPLSFPLQPVSVRGRTWSTVCSLCISITLLVIIS